MAHASSSSPQTFFSSLFTRSAANKDARTLKIVASISITDNTVAQADARSESCPQNVTFVRKAAGRSFSRVDSKQYSSKGGSWTQAWGDVYTAKQRPQEVWSRWGRQRCSSILASSAGIAVCYQIRCLNGFSRFLLPPFRQPSACRRTWTCHHYIVNTSKYTCDALIVLPVYPFLVHFSMLNYVCNYPNLRGMHMRRAYGERGESS